MDPFMSLEVVNRRNVPYEDMFDGIPVVFAPHESKHYPPNIAYALASRSTLKIDLASGVSTVFALGIPKDAEAFPADPLDGPLADKNNVEVLDRSNVERLTETEPQVLGQDGPESLGIGKVDKTVTPLPGAEDSQQIVKPAAADQVKPVSFVNDAVSRGPSRKGPSEHRVSHKPI